MGQKAQVRAGLALLLKCQGRVGFGFSPLDGSLAPQLSASEWEPFADSTDLVSEL